MAGYSVVYDDLVARWAVVDTNATGMVIGFKESEGEDPEGHSGELGVTWPDRYSEDLDQVH